MNTWLEGLLAVLIVFGAALTMIGSLGLLRFEHFFQRLHAPTKATTLGVGALLLASSIWFSATTGALSLHEVWISVFLFITAPVSAHLMARTALVQSREDSSLHDKDQAPDNQF